MTTPPPQDEPRPQLRRHRKNKVVAGVCGGLGRHFDLDPVVFRVVLGVLAVTGGVGLIFYGFAWLVIQQDGEDENEARRLLTGRVEGASMAAVLLALAGCGFFLSMLHYVSVLVFAALLSLATAGCAVWSERRRMAPPETASPVPGATRAPGASGTAGQKVPDAPPETKAPPTPGSPSWWRDPIVKDGTTGPVGSGYLWGPSDSAAEPPPSRQSPWTAAPAAASRGPRGIGGRVFLLALVAAGLGTGLAWHGHPVGTSLQIGLSCALAVFGLGMLLSAFVGRTGGGTLVMVVLTTGLLAGATALPKDVSPHWVRTDWRPTSPTDVRPRYQVGSGVGTLDLGGLDVAPGQSVSTRVVVGAGRATVVVPKNVTVRLKVTVGLGDVQLPGEGPNDIDISPGQDRTVTLPAVPVVGKAVNDAIGGAPRTVNLYVEVGVGQAEVTRAK
ncbi:PspC domain-containing protein [Streptomyces sp. NBC_01267]|uniref:PspC domain-containing protein n=1 Tax=unclassified Streptomyces TaxID=2593676 RepID=UPI002253F007|nr:MULTISPECIES: PspC domain-containing protein [unclassified Streptomyces]MCX4548793.1 PspC domain-containing protein [Streptomyces sp. NBC_01500]